jgi:hypothetical protein
MRRRVPARFAAERAQNLADLARMELAEQAAVQSREAYEASIARSPDAPRLAKLAAATFAALMIAGLAACGGAGHPASPASSPAASVQASSPSPQYLPTPPTLSQVAAELHATRVTDCGPAPAGGVTDSGIAHLGSERIGIDLFPSPDIRDGWKKLAAGFGIVVIAQGPTWAAYNASIQVGPACG